MQQPLAIRSQEVRGFLRSQNIETWGACLAYQSFNVDSYFRLNKLLRQLRFPRSGRVELYVDDTFRDVGDDEPQPAAFPPSREEVKVAPDEVRGTHPNQNLSPQRGRMSRRASQQSKILLPVLQFISTLRRTIKKDRKKPATRALKTEESQNPPPEKRSKVGFSSHPIENKHVTSKWPSKTKDLRKIGFRQISKQRTYVRPYQ